MDTKNSKNMTRIENRKEEECNKKQEAKKPMKEPKWGRDYKISKDR